ncbi:hypothetical protein N7478_004594 [Penicillium angulare]|uniref:uncharacterized protein n=1 Tax=Penicillium angulare TaxID=116970 RepID=UPI0025408B9F|nr:uncharacterized protein N7478_004594 [Penicillium angulare]KAJ5279222.1 hypothetical protein N7478_004594 [Penicillium angulare]
MGLWDRVQELLQGNRPKVKETFSLPDKDFEANKGNEIVEEEHQDERYLSTIPGAFPTSRPSSPQIVPSERVERHDVPTQEFNNRRDTTVLPIPSLHTDLAPHLHPLVSRSQTPAFVQTTPSTPVRPPSQRTYQEFKDFDDPWAERYKIYERFPFGRPVSAVQLVSPQSKPLPADRIDSIYRKEWERQQKAKLALEGEQGRPVRIRPQGKCVRLLSSDWSNRVSKAMYSSGAVAQSPNGDALYQKDVITCIKPFAWLNDEIINAYLEVVVRYLEKSTEKGKGPRYHAFSSFFYSTLRQKGYDGVRRWAKRAKIGGERLLEVDMVFVPVHESAHWTLMVVRPADRTIEYFDSLSDHGISSKVNTIKKWLSGELGANFVDDEWSVLSSVSSQQNNGSDCGVFLLTNAKAIALNIEPTAFGANDTTLLRQKIVAEIMNGGLHGDFSPIDSTGTILL